MGPGKSEKKKIYWGRVVTEPKRRESCQVNKKGGLQTSRALECEIIVRVGGSVRGLEREEINLEGRGRSGYDSPGKLA